LYFLILDRSYAVSRHPELVSEPVLNSVQESQAFMMLIRRLADSMTARADLIIIA